MFVTTTEATILYSMTSVLQKSLVQIARLDYNQPCMERNLEKKKSRRGVPNLGIERLIRY